MQIGLRYFVVVAEPRGLTSVEAVQRKIRNRTREVDFEWMRESSARGEDAQSLSVPTMRPIRVYDEFPF